MREFARKIAFLKKKWQKAKKLTLSPKNNLYLPIIMLLGEKTGFSKLVPAPQVCISAYKTTEHLCSSCPPPPPSIEVNGVGAENCRLYERRGTFSLSQKTQDFFSKSDCRLERMKVDDDTGYMTTEKQQQSYNDQTKIKKQPDYDPYADIEKLADLKQRGIITEEEFQLKKKDILNR